MWRLSRDFFRAGAARAAASGIVVSTLGLVVGGDDFCMAKFVAHQADLFDIGQVGSLGQGLLPSLGLVEVKPGAVIAQVF